MSINNGVSMKSNMYLLIAAYVVERGLRFLRIDLSAKTAPLPTELAGYKLVKTFDKRKPSDRNLLSIYRNDQGAEAFAKTWLGTFKNYDYYCLRNEIVSYKILNKFVNEGAVRIPKYIGHTETKNSLTLLIENVIGDSLYASPDADAQFTGFVRASAFLNYIGTNLTGSAKKAFSTRTGLDYLLQFPLLVVKALLTNGAHKMLILRGAGYYLRNVFFFLSIKELVLSHRDLHLENIISSGDKLYLLDLENCAYTWRFYDEALTLRNNWGLSAFREKLQTHLTEFTKGSVYDQKQVKLLLIENCVRILTAGGYSEKKVNSFVDCLEYALNLKVGRTGSLRMKVTLSLRMLVFRLIHFATAFIFKSTVSVLCYHSISNSDDRYAVTVQNFEKQMDKLKKSFRFVNLDEVLKYASTPNKDGNCVALTFDDGFEDMFSIVPYLTRSGIPVTVFVLSDPENIERKELHNKHVLLSDESIKRLLDAGVEIGCHSATHKNLVNVSAAELEKEIAFAKNRLEEKFNIKVKYFAYPKGYYTNYIMEVVKKAGYSAAFCINLGCVDPRSDKFALPRSIVDNTHQLSEFPALFSRGVCAFKSALNRYKIWDRFLRV